MERQKQNEVDLDDILDTVFEFSGIGGYGQPLAPSFQRDVDPKKIRWEFAELTRLLENQRPEVILEIGSASGGTAYLWSRYLDSVETIVGIDNGVSFEKQLPLLEQFTDDVDLHFLPLDSHYPETKETIENRLSGLSVDFLFLNGDKTYEGLKQDFEEYRELVAPDGILAFHDIVENPEYERVNTHQFWNDVCAHYETREIISSDDQNWGGIGLLYL